MFGNQFTMLPYQSRMQMRKAFTSFPFASATPVSNSQMTRLLAGCEAQSTTDAIEK